MVMFAHVPIFIGYWSIGSSLLFLFLYLNRTKNRKKANSSAAAEIWVAISDINKIWTPWCSAIFSIVKNVSPHSGIHREIYAKFYVSQLVYHNIVYAFLFVCCVPLCLCPHKVMIHAPTRTLHAKHIDKTHSQHLSQFQKATHKDQTQRLFSSEIQHFHAHIHPYVVYTVSKYMRQIYQATVWFFSIASYAFFAYIFFFWDYTIFQFQNEIESRKTNFRSTIFLSTMLLVQCKCYSEWIRYMQYGWKFNQAFDSIYTQRAKRQ